MAEISPEAGKDEYRDKLISDGYTEAHAERMAKLAFPTKREAALRKARVARKANSAK